MAAAPTFPLVTEEEYLRSSYEPECEYVDGVLEPKALPSPPHALLHNVLIELLIQHQRSHGYRALTEVRIQISPRRYRVPDIALMPTEYVKDWSLKPLATIEILSPDDRMTRVMATVRDQHSIGVGTIIVADPQERTVLVADAGGLLRQVAPAVITLELPDRPSLTIDFDQLFAEVPTESE